MTWFGDLPRVFLVSNVVKSDVEIVSLLPFTPIKLRGLVNIYAFSYPTAQYCSRTPKTPGK